MIAAGASTVASSGHFNSPAPLPTVCVLCASKCACPVSCCAPLTSLDNSKVTVTIHRVLRAPRSVEC
ncbi:hypothetical protein A0H81_09145 [Grifola frondosa]|uniref:Uncharacterized protein n=1 Tax=Grifola frondosa TaxID=5627 RepID=A0A1C7M1B7_GRIFR|nr:hypothetical protein A0H81_09145 [Grifola frondosa]